MTIFGIASRSFYSGVTCVTVFVLVLTEIGTLIVFYMTNARSVKSRGRKTAKIALARRLAVHLYWMWRQGWDCEHLIKFGSHAGEPGNRHGAR